jgi:hypothetical protein
MAFDLHQDLAEWIDRESVRVAGLVQDVTGELPQNGGLKLHPDHPIAAHIGPDDIIGEPIASSVDIAGNIVARFYQHHERTLGLVDDGMREAQKIAERIWSRNEIVNLLSRSTILDLLLDWVGSVACGMPTFPLSTKLTQTVREMVSPLTIWIPLSEVFVSSELPFGTAVLAPLTRNEFDAAIQIGTSQPHSDRSEQWRENIYPKWLGTVVMRFELTAEPQRAEELAAERAANYMALLQFYAAPTMILPLTSHAAPRGARPYRAEESIVYGPERFTRTERISEPPYRLEITSQYRAEMERLGLLVLSALAKETTCEYEEKLLEGLLVYGRACYQLDPTDKLLQVMTAVEMFALRSDNEPIQAALADRLAFAITNNPDRRALIAQNLRAAYSVRSGRTHHGKSITETATIEEFLRNAWAFFLTAIQGVGHFQKRIEFLDHLDKVKYGHR